METVASVRSKRQRKGESRAVTGRNTKFAEHVPQKKGRLFQTKGPMKEKARCL